MDLKAGPNAVDFAAPGVGAIQQLGNVIRGRRPAEDLFGLVGAHIDAAVAHGGPEIVVPVSAVESLAVAGEERGPWHARQLIVVGAGKQVAVAHVLGWSL